MRRAGPHMARAQRRPSYGEAVLALRPTWYSHSQIPGGRLDYDPGLWDQTFLAGVGQNRTAMSGTAGYDTPGVRIAPGLSLATHFQGDGFWTYPQIFAATLPFAISLWFTEDASFDLSRSNLLSQSNSTATYNDVDVMVWTGAGNDTINLSNIRSSGSLQDNGAISIQAAARVRAHHVAVVKTTTGDSPSSMVLDGVPAGPENITCVDNGSSLRIGGNTGGFWREWKGLISDVAIWGGGTNVPIPTLDSLARLYGLGNGGSARLGAT